MSKHTLIYCQEEKLNFKTVGHESGKVRKEEQKLKAYLSLKISRNICGKANSQVQEYFINIVLQTGIYLENI